MKLKIFILMISGLLLQNSSIYALEKSPKKEKEEKETKLVLPEENQPSWSGQIFSGTKTHSFGIGLGETFMTSDFSDNGENSITVDGYYTYAASHSFEFLLNVHYSTHPTKTTQTTLAGIAMAIKSKLYQFDAFSPYIMGGLGFYRPRLSFYRGQELIESESKTTFGVHAGAGGDLRLNDLFSVGLLMHYHNPFDFSEGSGIEVEGSYFKLLMTLMVTI